MEANNSVDLEKTCRSCLKIDNNTDEYIRIFESGLKDRTASKDTLEGIDCLRLRITKDDGLPQKICIHCRETFAFIGRFKRRCVDAQDRLRQIFQSIISDSQGDNLIFVIDKDPFHANLAQPSQSQIMQNVVEHDHEVMGYESVKTDVEGEKNEKMDCIKEGTRDVETTNSPDESVLFEDDDDSSEEDDTLEANDEQTNIAAAYKKWISDKNRSKKRPHRCSICGHSYQNAESLEEHKRTHNSNEFKCDICHQKFANLRNVVNHKRAIHESGKYPCTICDRVLHTEYRFTYHMRTHYSEKKYKCKYCSKAFMLRQHLENHERTHTGNRPYVCSECGKTFITATCYKMHIRRHGEKTYKCDTCGRVYSQQKTLLRHTCNPTINYPNKNQNQTKKQCEVCGKCVLNLKVHMVSHTGVKPFKCDTCDRAYLTLLELKFHKYKIHNVKRFKPDKKYRIVSDKSYEPQVCPICSKLFAQPCHLRLHMKSHSDERNYPCEICDKSFKQKGHLTLHIDRIHLKKRPYGCEIYDKRFATAGDMRIHMKTHKMDNSELPDQVSVNKEQ